MDPKTLFTIIHLFGVALGAGGAFMTDSVLLTAVKDHKLTKDEYAIIKKAGMVVMLGLALLILSGIGLYMQDPAYYMSSSKFISKMIIVLILSVNGIVLHKAVLPYLKKNLGVHLLHDKEFSLYIPLLIFLGAVSFTSWFFALVLGALRSINYAVIDVLLIYVSAVVLVSLIGVIAYKMRKKNHSV